MDLKASDKTLQKLNEVKRSKANKDLVAAAGLSENYTLFNIRNSQ
jgi:hypothetical protein